ncbi:hypothetical protein CHS0354_007154 [Potamilus streckersoni]|uniref:Uncharacterized protein n=1 Tax=Potamilus streckersoni TaxID=2493646 RepID=A0AAE0VUM3_9BIVA|nr:hypothetical protein CHS0354_007154 [Potamilus streckersoni]
MRTLSGPAVLLIVVVLLRTTFAYVEALSANVEAGTARSAFEPGVAFICNKPAMHRTVNGWEVDQDTDCLTEPKDILEYCKKTYPNHDITNIVETYHKVTITDWPSIFRTKSSHKVYSYRCIDGPFESEALLVPQHCSFDHQHDKICMFPSYWNETAQQECAKKDMELESFGMLVDCDIDKFHGVEFVCCPHKTTQPQAQIQVVTEPRREDTSEPRGDDYLAYLHGDDDFLSKYENEHQKYKAAENAMLKRHHEKITKMMKEWQAARDHVAELRKTDFKAAEQLNGNITQKFQQLYHAYEQEGQAEKKQLVALHQQHIQGELNKRKRVALEAFMDALQTPEPKTAEVLRHLRAYIRAEEKDRLHTVNHFEHLRDTDPQEAQKVRDQTLEHLKLITDRITQAMDMLHRFPDVEKKILPEIKNFREKFQTIESSATNVVLQPITFDEQKEMLDKYKQTAKDTEKDTVLEPKETETVVLDVKQNVQEKTTENQSGYQNIHIDSESDTIETEKQPFVAYKQHDQLAVHAPSFVKAKAEVGEGGSVAGIAIGSVAVFIIIVIAIIMLRKRSQRQPITHGFVEVDPAASPEERHVTNMQMNGYENPTYRYFEMSQNN